MDAAAPLVLRYDIDGMGFDLGGDSLRSLRARPVKLCHGVFPLRSR
jgi:hypothetical protein